MHQTEAEKITILSTKSIVESSRTVEAHNSSDPRFALQEKLYEAEAERSRLQSSLNGVQSDLEKLSADLDKQAQDKRKLKKESFLFKKKIQLLEKELSFQTFLSALLQNSLSLQVETPRPTKSHLYHPESSLNLLKKSKQLFLQCSWRFRGNYGARKSAEESFQEILRSGLFLPDYYLLQRLGVANSPRLRGRSPRALVIDYLSFGATKDLDPHPLFCTRFYKERNFDIGTLNPLLHFIRSGYREWRDPSPLFSLYYYCSHSPMLLPNNINPLVDYLSKSNSELMHGTYPLAHPLFDEGYYLRKNRDVLLSGEQPLIHFLQSGARERRDPSAIFDSEFYEKASARLKAEDNLLLQYLDTPIPHRHSPHELIDFPCYYRQIVPGTEHGIDPLIHFLTSGAQENFQPHLLFDTAYYRSQFSNDDKLRSMNPLAHYVEFGFREGKNPHPLFQSSFYLREFPEARSFHSNPLSDYLKRAETHSCSPHILFQPEFYKNQDGDELSASDIPLLHFLKHGHESHRSPHPLFDTSFYCETYRDVTELRENPLLHYLKIGAKEGRNPNPFFETRFYEKQNPGLRESLYNPLVHYLETGWLSEKNPSKQFHVSYYLESYPDVISRDAEPLTHYLQIGQYEGRLSTPLSDLSYAEWHKRYERFTPLEEKQAKEHFATFTQNPLISCLAPHISSSREFAELFNSLCSQLYSNWELLLPESASKLEQSLHTLLKEDRRVRFITCQEETIEQKILPHLFIEARGAWLTVREKSVTYHPTAFGLVADFVCRNPDVCALYGDHDIGNSADEKIDHVFKPDWDEILFKNYDYLSPACFFSHKVVIDQPSSRNTGDSWSQIILNSLTRDKTRNGVGHIRHALVQQVQAYSPEDIIKRTERSLGTEFQAKNCRISCVIPYNQTRYSKSECQQFIEALLLHEHLEIILPDTDLRSISHPRVRSLPVRMEQPLPALLNELAAAASHDAILFLNPEIVTPAADGFRSLYTFAANTDAAIVTGQIRLHDKTLEEAGLILGGPQLVSRAFAGHPESIKSYLDLLDLPHQVSAISKDFLFIRKQVFREFSGFDSRSYEQDFFDVDLCLRVREKGYCCAYHPSTTVFLGESFSQKGHHRFATIRDRRALLKKWERELQNDSFYNPNLSFAPSYRLAIPPREPYPWQTRTATSSADVPERDSRLNFYVDEGNYQRSCALSTKQAERQSKSRLGSGLSVVILNLDKPDLIIPLLDSLRAAKIELAKLDFCLEIIVGDTGTTHTEVLNYYDSHQADFHCARNLTYQFSRCNNVLFDQYVSQQSVLFLNNDIIFENPALELKALFELLHDSPKNGIVGSYLFYPSGNIQHKGIQFFREGTLRQLSYHPGHNEPLLQKPEFNFSERTPAVTGACLAMHSELFVDLGGFDEQYETECQDVALCLSAHRLGYQCQVGYFGNIVHLENATRPKGSEDWRDRRRFVRKWGTYVTEIFS